MAKINLYKIDERYHQSFLRYLEEKLELKNDKELLDVNKEKHYFKFYEIVPTEEKPLGWKWILDEFSIRNVLIKSQPKAVLTIEFNDEMYAVTFGSSFFLVDKFADGDYPFEFARRVNLTGIKTTTLLSPNMKRNKNISTYVDYSELDFDSGESFVKLKANLALNENEKEFLGETIEFGNSIKFDLKNPRLINLMKLLNYVNSSIENDEIYAIPVFKKVIDDELIKKLESNLTDAIKKDSSITTISELDIIGVTEVFNNQDALFELRLSHKHKKVTDLNYSELEKFALEKEFDLAGKILEIVVKSFYNGEIVRSDKIRNLIDYVDDEERCILNKGNWYHYNDDYQKYLAESISELEVIYNPKYDFSDIIHTDFVEGKFVDEKDNEDYKGLSDNKIKEKLKKKYYAERTFNLIRENDGFTNYDRVTSSFGGAQIELMDLYRDETMYAVKIGKASSGLCYAVDQSISSLRMYKHKTLENMPEIKNVAVWLILQRDELELNYNGQPNLNNLKMIMLKNKLDSWKKEVRLQGLKPIIYINYKKTI